MAKRRVARGRIVELAHYPRQHSAEPGTRGVIELGDGRFDFDYPRMLVPQLFQHCDLGIEYEEDEGGARRLHDLWLLRDAVAPSAAFAQLSANGLLTGLAAAAWDALVERAAGKRLETITAEEIVEAMALHYGLGATERALADRVLVARPVQDPPRDGWDAQAALDAFRRLTGVAAEGANAFGPTDVEFGEEGESIDVTGTLDPLADAFGEALDRSSDMRLYALASRADARAFVVRTRVEGEIKLLRDASRCR